MGLRGGSVLGVSAKLIKTLSKQLCDSTHFLRGSTHPYLHPGPSHLILDLVLLLEGEGAWDRLLFSSRVQIAVLFTLHQPWKLHGHSWG